MRSRGLCLAVSHLRGFARNAEGVAGLEFAMIVPFMLALYLGSIEVGNAMAVQFKIALATRAVADLASQYTSINNSTMSGILAAASTVVAPYSASGMVVTITEITTNSAGQGTITWSDSLNGTAHSVGQSVTLPTALQIASTSMIWSEVTYPYKPTFGYVLTSTINISQSGYFYPRLSSSVTRVNS
ncbi:TadE/TadG family type IV pilus assembly protein [Bradyrhizobium sp.]|jgi:Flp pilus assembly protein TadG|uniref:TadE/TadG family type IV pilus assembly protein n=1 Tax=Bradyrhizobium sp. TaxID=376 RepID=UPI003C234293